MDIWFPLIGDWTWRFGELDFANGGAVWIMVNWNDLVYTDCLEHISLYDMIDMLAFGNAV
jgi:hypothetical protein